MSDTFRPLGAGRLAAWIAAELDRNRSVFGLPEPLWFRPRAGNPLALELHGARLGTPIGAAAGPHTQLAQNIVAAWLCGARVIELKTVQTLDRIEVAKPCIDMRDEGTNTEWSQELTVRESFREYLAAWVVIHALHARLGMPGERPDVLFDVSVGYDLDGLRQPNMRWFLEHVADAGDELERCRSEVARHLPEAAGVEIPSRIASSATLSTLHGCPPDQIGDIAEYLLDRRRLHTAVKLNPTLIGLDEARRILVDDLGWRHLEPDPGAFDADIDFSDALGLIARLEAAAARSGRSFSLKLCNTLPVRNTSSELGGGQPVAYLSGRPLHALAVELARRMVRATDGRLPISFAGGADAFNTPALLAAGLRPVTLCSDLLRPGGYLRLRQVLDELSDAMAEVGADALDELVVARAGGGLAVGDAARVNLDRYADTLRGDPQLACDTFRRDHTKTGRRLGLFDCIVAPCTDACAVDQRVPEYMRRVAAGDVVGAAEVIAADNPLPSILGRACHHPCEEVCLRTHLDQPLAIREVKRFVTDHAPPPRRSASAPTDLRVAVVGAGPCGLAAALELVAAGARVVVFEARDEPGGMVSATIPGYRAGDAAVRRDLDAALAAGVVIEHGTEIGRDRTLEELVATFDAVVVAAGAQRGRALGLDGEDADGISDGLDFLRAVRRGHRPDLGGRVGVVGGGDFAIDCARTARRLTDGRVELLYRRTVSQMPAHPDELRVLERESIGIRELVAPRRIDLDGDRLHAVECAEMTLGEPDADGRPRPTEVPGGTVVIGLDTLIVAIGQRPDLRVFGGSPVAITPAGYVDVDPETLECSLPGVFVGGDLRDPGPSSIVDACGDGRRIARAVLNRAGIAMPSRVAESPPQLDPADLQRRRSTRRWRIESPRRVRHDLGGFDEEIETLEPAAAAAEASRCLDCDLLCSTCDGVCPNRAIVTYFLAAGAPGPSQDAAPFQGPQVAVVADLCNECGNCATFCPTAGRPYRDKPRIHLHRGDFEAAADNAFMRLTVAGRSAIQGRFGGHLHQLEIHADRVLYRGPDGAASFDGATFEPLEIRLTGGGPGTQDVDLEPAAVLWALLRGLDGSMSHLPAVEAEPDWLLPGG